MQAASWPGCAANWPAGHEAHTLGVWRNWPIWHAKHDVLPVALLTAPDGHGKHAAAPLLGMNEPIEHGSHADAPTDVLLAALY